VTQNTDNEGHPPPLDLTKMKPLGFIWDGCCFEFREGGTVEVEGWSGDLGNGWTYEIRGGDVEKVDEDDL
jgi:hypothetical protein